MHCRLRTRGFTLLEILVAFVVLAVGAGILYRTFSLGLNSVGTSSGYSEAIAVAEAKLGALGLEKPLAEGEESGTTEDHRFEWRVAVQLYTPPGENAEQALGTVAANQLYRATVYVTWDPRADRRRMIELSTLRLRGKPPV
jgi:general secretion pathway protein I